MPKPACGPHLPAARAAWIAVHTAARVSGMSACVPSWANLVRSGSGLDGFDDLGDMVG